MESSSSSEESRAEETKAVRRTDAFSQEDLAVGSLNLSKLEKGEVVKKFRVNAKDVGSPEVQVALLTRRLESMTKHFASHPKDRHSQRGMLDIISHRKRLLGYLRREDVSRYRATISALGLRK